MAAVPSEGDPSSVLAKIGAIATSVVNDILEQRPTSVPIRSRQAGPRGATRASNGWPGATADHAWRFGVPCRLRTLVSSLMRAA